MKDVGLSSPRSARAFTCTSSWKPLRRRPFGAVDTMEVPGYLSLRSQAAAGIESPDGPPEVGARPRRAQAPRRPAPGLSEPPGSRDRVAWDHPLTDRGTE